MNGCRRQRRGKGKRRTEYSSGVMSSWSSSVTAVKGFWISATVNARRNEVRRRQPKGKQVDSNPNRNKKKRTANQRPTSRKKRASAGSLANFGNDVSVRFRILREKVPNLHYHQPCPYPAIPKSPKRTTATPLLPTNTTSLIK
jgi:hypothetical protein